MGRYLLDSDFAFFFFSAFIFIQVHLLELTITNVDTCAIDIDDGSTVVNNAFYGNKDGRFSGGLVSNAHISLCPQQGTAFK